MTPSGFVARILVVTSFVLLQYPSYAAVSDTFETEAFETRELKLHLSYGIGYSMEEVEFKPRGSITVRNFKGPKYTVQQEKIPVEELKKLEEMARQDAYYFLSVSIKYPSGEKTFSTFAPVKSVVDSGLSDVVSIHLVPSGEIFSISYSMSVNNFMSQQNGIRHQVPRSQQYNTTVLVHSGENGPVPDTAPYLEKLEMEKLARERGDEGRDNRSFLAKYWMYIVPVALLVLLSGASNPEGGS